MNDRIDPAELIEPPDGSEPPVGTPPVLDGADESIIVIDDTGLSDTDSAVSTGSGARPSRLPPSLRRNAAGEPFFAVRPRRALLEAASVAIIAWVWTAVLYRLWEASPRVPIYQDRSDARLIANILKNIIDRGWYETNPHLGAPFGQELYDFPHGGETWQFVIFKGMSYFIHDYGLMMNVYFIAGFGVTAAVTFLVLRHLRFSYAVSAVIGILYVFLPFHFYHEQSHLYRSSYFYAPIACLVLVWAMQWRERFLLDPDADDRGGVISTLRWTVRHNLRWRRVGFIVAACVLIGGTETMTTSFTMVLLAVTGIVGALRHREPARLLVSFGLAAVIAVTFLTLLFPTLHYVHKYGTNEKAARRIPTEQELYGLKISRMVLPSGDHRYAKFRDIGNKGQEGTRVLSEGGQALTILGTIGFISALFWLIFRSWGRLPLGKRRDDRPPHDRMALLDNGSLLIFASTMIGTVAGLAMVLSVMGFSQVRVWNRIVLIIAFFSFVFTGHWFEKLGRWIQGKLNWATPVLVVLTLAVGAFGVWDGGRPAGRDYKAMDADFASDKAFVAEIESKMPDGTNVFQLPVVPFPEQPPPGKMLDYDQLRPFLQSDGSINWSYGKVKGRPNADWQWKRVRDHVGIVDSLPGLLGMGFTGLWVDPFGYDDGGVKIRQQLIDILGVQPLVAPNGRQMFFDMRPYKDRLGKSDAELRAIAKDLFLIPPPPAR